MARLTIELESKKSNSVRMTLVLFEAIHSLFVLSLGIVILEGNELFEFFSNPTQWAFKIFGEDGNI